MTSLAPNCTTDTSICQVKIGNTGVFQFSGAQAAEGVLMIGPVNITSLQFDMLTTVIGVQSLFLPLILLSSFVAIKTGKSCMNLLCGWFTNLIYLTMYLSEGCLVYIIYFQADTWQGLMQESSAGSAVSHGVGFVMAVGFLIWVFYLCRRVWLCLKLIRPLGFCAAWRGPYLFEISAKGKKYYRGLPKPITSNVSIGYDGRAVYGPGGAIMLRTDDDKFKIRYCGPAGWYVMTERARYKTDEGYHTVIMTAGPRKNYATATIQSDLLP